MELKGKHQLLHGGDYNPDQWLDREDILAEDIRLMKLAHVNVVTLGVFAWSTYEPAEGEFHFEWLDHIMDSMHENGIHVILSTPSSAMPPWMARKYPDIMRMTSDRRRLLYGNRSMFCKSSTVYRKKVEDIDRELAKRYAEHPALIMWHISNEVYSDCHCPECQKNFRNWLENKYRTIENLNKNYWSAFWSHGYSQWEEIETPSSIGENGFSPLSLDYKRFNSDLSMDFIRHEIDTVKEYDPKIPVTTNMFHHNCGINYQELARILDVISWDSYPRWHCGQDKSTEWANAVNAAFDFDFCRSLRHKPFYLMESAPGVPSQFEVCKLKRPGMHVLAAVEAIACGSESVQYFQWRKGRGGYEKFHGAVVGHDGTADTRVFREVTQAGELLRSLGELQGTGVKAGAAVIFDWENMRALEGETALKKKKDFEAVIHRHYEALLKNYAAVDIISAEDDFSAYRMIAAPSLYCFKDGIGAKIRKYIENGGHFVLTYNSGIVNENDIAYEGFAPYSLNDVFGVCCEETDALCDGEYNVISYRGKTYKALDYCAIVKMGGAEKLAEYTEDFYSGCAALARKRYGRGTAYYIACHSEDAFLFDVYGDIMADAHVYRVDAEYVPDVMIRERGRHIFLMNFSTEERKVVLNKEAYTLPGYGYKMIREDSVKERIP